LIRGLHPWPHAFSFLGGNRFILRRSSVEESGETGQPGTILEVNGDRLLIATGDGHLRVVEIQAEGKRPMTAREFLAGHRLTAGDRFTA
jgi:methionyl-tRNA formyltransferase